MYMLTQKQEEYKYAPLLDDGWKRTYCSTYIHVYVSTYIQAYLCVCNCSRIFPICHGNGYGNNLKFNLKGIYKKFQSETEI